MTDARTAPEKGLALQLKARLLGISPMVWRRVLVPETMSLHELHGVLQMAMGWEAIHLFQFNVRGVVYAGPYVIGASYREFELTCKGLFRHSLKSESTLTDASAGTSVRL